MIKNCIADVILEYSTGVWFFLYMCKMRPQTLLVCSFAKGFGVASHVPLSSNPTRAIGCERAGSVGQISKVPAKPPRGRESGICIPLLNQPPGCRNFFVIACHMTRHFVVSELLSPTHPQSGVTRRSEGSDDVKSWSICLDLTLERSVDTIKYLISEIRSFTTTLFSAPTVSVGLRDRTYPEPFVLPVSGSLLKNGCIHNAIVESTPPLCTCHIGHSIFSNTSEIADVVVPFANFPTCLILLSSSAS